MSWWNPELFRKAFLSVLLYFWFNIKHHSFICSTNSSGIWFIYAMNLFFWRIWQMLSRCCCGGDCNKTHYRKSVFHHLLRQIITTRLYCINKLFAFVLVRCVHSLLISLFYGKWIWIIEIIIITLRALKIRKFWSHHICEDCYRMPYSYIHEHEHEHTRIHINSIYARI